MPKKEKPKNYSDWIKTALSAKTIPTPKPKTPKPHRQVTHNLRRRMGR